MKPRHILRGWDHGAKKKEAAKGEGKKRYFFYWRLERE